jgi:hypothetical protein
MKSLLFSLFIVIPVKYIKYLMFIWPCIMLNLLVIKPARCTNFSIWSLEWNSTCFGQFLCPSSGIFHYTHSSGICHTGLLTACEQDQDGTETTRGTKCLNLCLEWNSTCFGQFLCPSSGVFHFPYSSGICHTGFILILLASCQQTCMTYTFAVCAVKNFRWWTGTLRNM